MPWGSCWNPRGLGGLKRAAFFPGRLSCESCPSPWVPVKIRALGPAGPEQSCRIQSRWAAASLGLPGNGLSHHSHYSSPALLFHGVPVVAWDKKHRHPAGAVASFLSLSRESTCRPDLKVSLHISSFGVQQVLALTCCVCLWSWTVLANIVAMLLCFPGISSLIGRMEDKQVNTHRSA